MAHEDLPTILLLPLPPFIFHAIYSPGTGLLPCIQHTYTPHLSPAPWPPPVQRLRAPTTTLLTAASGFLASCLLLILSQGTSSVTSNNRYTPQGSGAWVGGLCKIGAVFVWNIKDSDWSPPEWWSGYSLETNPLLAIHTFIHQQRIINKIHPSILPSHHLLPNNILAAATLHFRHFQLPTAPNFLQTRQQTDPFIQLPIDTQHTGYEVASNIMINLKRNRSSIPTPAPISTQPISKLSRLKTGFNVFNKLTTTNYKNVRAQNVHTSPPVSPPSPQEDRFPILYLFRDHSADNLDTFMHNDKLKMMHRDKKEIKPTSRFTTVKPDDDQTKSNQHMLKNAQTVSNDTTDKRTTQKSNWRRRASSISSTRSMASSKFSFTPRLSNNSDAAKQVPPPLPSPASSRCGRGHQISSSPEHSLGSGSLTAREFAKEAGIALRTSESDDETEECQFTMNDSFLSRESGLLPIAGKGMTVRSSGGKSLNSVKAKLNIWEDTFWKKPGTEDEPLSPPLSPTSAAFTDLSSSISSEGPVSHSPSMDNLLNSSQCTHHSSPLPKPNSQVKFYDAPLSSSYPSNNSTRSFSTNSQSTLPISIPPPPKDDSIAEPPFLAQLRRVSMVPPQDTSCLFQGIPPLPNPLGKAAVIRKGRFEIVLGGQAKDAEPSLNPLEVPHQHHQQHLHECASRKSSESERDRIREWRSKKTRARTSSDAGSSSFDDRSEVSVKLGGSTKTDGP